VWKVSGKETVLVKELATLGGLNEKVNSIAFSPE